FYERATVIAGDYLYTKKYAPDNLDNKIILTNTTTAEDIDSLKDRGVAAVITTTPRVQGRSFGTNVLEAAVTAYSGLNRQLTDEEMKKCVDDLGLKAQVHRF
ncbi:MAG: quinate 5-dehydrogenase, partial [Candidatus Heimdallarchaeota archaeon]|nr:quinate 5-dehydrogenase [Candidatus Heimdallarchaeota archaeon]